MKSTKVFIAVAIAILVIVFFFGPGILDLFGFGAADNSLNTQTTVEDYGLRSITVPQDQLHAIADGLLIYDVKNGDGSAAKKGDQVAVHYVGKFLDGTQFDSSLDRQQPLVFSLGTGQVIPGWEQGIVGMKVGGIRHLVIPPNLAYGSQGVKGSDGSYIIPPNATLVFDVVLLNIGQTQ